MNVSLKYTDNFAWQCAFTGEIYRFNDPRLVGQGEPPSSPNTPAGIGSIPMQLIRVEPPTPNQDPE